MSKNKKEERGVNSLLSCSVCNGGGFDVNNKSCEACQGSGVFLLVGNGAKFYWGRKLIGRPVIVEKIRWLLGKIAQSLFSVFTIFTLLYGIYFIVLQNQYFWDVLTERLSEVLSDSDMAGAWFSFLFYFVIDILDSFVLVLSDKGAGPLAFWLGLLGVIYFYYKTRSKELSQKEISPSDSDLQAFYNPLVAIPQKPIDISVYASPAVISVLEKSLNLAHDLKQVPGIFHLAKILASEVETVELMKRIELDSRDFLSYLDSIIEAIPQDQPSKAINFFVEIPMSVEMKKIAVLSFEETLLAGFDKIELESLFLTLFYDQNLNKYFHDHKLEAKDIRSAILWSKTWSNIRFRNNRPRRIKHTIMNKAWTARVTPELDRFTEDLTDQARYGLTGYVVNRQREVNSLMRILERTSQNNALLVGEEGSGRTSIVKALANRMIHDEVLPTLQDKRLVVLDIGALVSGARAGGDLELRIREILSDMGMSGNIILYIPDIHNMAAAGSGEGFDASKILAPILSQNLFQIIGSTDHNNYHRYIEPRSDFANSFDVIKVEELSEDDTLKVVAINAGMIENREGVIMTYGAIKQAVELSKRYITDKLLPGKAVDLLAETAVEVRRRGEWAVMRDEDIMAVITEKTGIPLTSINTDEAEKLLGLEDNLHARVIGQNFAVKAVSSAIRRVRVGMKMQNRPIGVFLFLGPTGVGKTELAKALAEVYYGDENAMVRLDMSEYQTIESVEKLIGYSSDNSESSGGGILTEAVKRQPFSLILLDELEKAHKNVLNLFLQVFDDGRLTDSLGRTVDFTNTIIIATSNAGSKVMQKIFTEDESSDARVMEMLSPYLIEYFSPEFLNRFTDKIVFRSLGREDLMKIMKLQIRNLASRLNEAQGIAIEIDDDTLSYLLEIGYSAEYGARFMQRTVQEKLENLIAVEFLKGNIKRGDTFHVALEDLKKL